MSPGPAPFTLEAGGQRLAGETVGEGPTVVLAHGLTATRRYVLHGSRVLERGGLRTVSYDARGHGESAPAPPGAGYSYAELATDLGAVIAAQAAGPAVLAGHSMGAHTIAALALADPSRIAAVVLIGPASLGLPPAEEVIAHWDALADGLERGGPEGFIEVYDHGLDPRWRETLLRITRQRLDLHRDPGALAGALRGVPRSLPFEGIAELSQLELPALVVASHDEADPGHPYSVAEAWAEALPAARLVSELPGSSPLAWQGGRLSREIATFCATDAVRERLG